MKSQKLTHFPYERHIWHSDQVECDNNSNWIFPVNGRQNERHALTHSTHFTLSEEHNTKSIKHATVSRH